MNYRKMKKDILSDKTLPHRYFDYDGKQLSLKLKYESGDELFDTRLMTQSPIVNDNFYDYIDYALTQVNARSDVNLEVTVADNSFTQSQLDNYIADNLRLHVYEYMRQNRKQVAICITLLCGGSALLVLSYFLGAIFEFDLIFDVVNLLGSLLIWSSGEKFFLDRKRDRYLCHRYMEILNGLTTK